MKILWEQDRCNVGKVPLTMEHSMIGRIGKAARCLMVSPDHMHAFHDRKDWFRNRKKRRNERATLRSSYLSFLYRRPHCPADDAVSRRAFRLRRVAADGSSVVVGEKPRFGRVRPTCPPERGGVFPISINKDTRLSLNTINHLPT